MHDVRGMERERDAGGRKMTRRETMTRVRGQVLLLRRLNEQLKELSPDGVRSLRLGGTPGGRGGVPRGLDVQMERREALERMIRRESALLREYEAAARKEMDGMKPGEYAFCLMYYIGAYSIEETSRAIDRSVRQCERYRSAIGGQSRENVGEMSTIDANKCLV